jgi:hypothetical protein
MRPAPLRDVFVCHTPSYSGMVRQHQDDGLEILGLD